MTLPGNQESPPAVGGLFDQVSISVGRRWLLLTLVLIAEVLWGTNVLSTPASTPEDGLLPLLVWHGSWLLDFGLAMVAAGLKSGDKALVYDIWHQEGRSESPRGIKEALEAAGLVVDTLDVTNDVDTEASLAIPILTAYMEANPDLKAIGTQHGNITSTLPKVLETAGKKPGDVISGGIDLSPATIDGIQKGWISASFDQVLYLQGYFPVQQIWLMANYLIPGLHINRRIRQRRANQRKQILSSRFFRADTCSTQSKEKENQSSHDFLPAEVPFSAKRMT